MGKSLVIRISPVLRHFLRFFFLLETGKMYFLPVFLLTCFLSAIEDVSAATAKYDWGRLAPVKTAQQLKRQAAPGAHASQTGEKRQRNSFGMCGTQSIIAAMENAAGIKNEARAEHMRQMDCATELRRMADPVPPLYDYHHAHGKKRQRNSFGMCGTQSIISALENAAGIKNEARAEKMRQMDCATHLRRLADSVPSSPLAQASQIGKKRQMGISLERNPLLQLWNMPQETNDRGIPLECLERNPLLQIWNMPQETNDRGIPLECVERNP